MIYSWKGKPFQECSREELIEALRYWTDDGMQIGMSGYKKRVNDLEKEIEIKNDVIDRLIKR